MQFSPTWNKAMMQWCSFHQLGTRQWCNDAVFTNVLMMQWCNDAVFTNLEQGNDAMMQFSPTWNDAMMQFSEHEASWRNELLSEIRCRELGMFLVSFQTVCVCFQVPTLVLCALSWTVSFRNFYVATSQNWTRQFQMNCSVWDAFVSLILSISLIVLCHRQHGRESQNRLFIKVFELKSSSQKK